MDQDISVERAVELITKHTKPVGTERIPATQAYGRILAEDVVSPMDQPPWPRSPLDGYAFQAADSVGASGTAPVLLRVADTIYAGGWSNVTVAPGEAVRLMTGAPIPTGCDCVIRQEDTDFGAEMVQIFRELSPWENFCFAGEDFHTGEVILPEGTRMTGNALGVLASAGLFREENTTTKHRITERRPGPSTS